MRLVEAGCALMMISLHAASALTDAGREHAFVGYSEKGTPMQASGALCTDDSSFCGDWAQQGECTKNAGYMDAGCQLSCNKCTAQQMPPLDPADERTLVLTTQHGDIRISLRPNLAPNTVAQIITGVQAGGCNSNCRFYRAERIPEPGAIDNFGGPGPPYALLQGSLPPVPGGWKALAVESAPLVERGMVCLIGGGPDFFIAVGPHHEWAHAHTVWGQVEDMSVVEAIVATPVQEETWGQTHVTTLVTKVEYRPSLEERADT